MTDYAIYGGLGLLLILVIVAVAYTVMNNKKLISEGYANYASASPQLYSSKMPSISEQVKDTGIKRGGTQNMAYQLFQQNINAATPTLSQLEMISGQSQEQTGEGAIKLGGGLSSVTAPYAMMADSGNDTTNSEFQVVNMGSDRAQSISACSQNAPTFVASQLLPKPSIPGQQSWDVGAPNNALANQNYLSSVQQIGLDTVMASTRNQSYDIRNNIPNPMKTYDWNNSVIMPDLQKRPLDTFLPSHGLYGPGEDGYNSNPTYVGDSD